MMFRRSLAALLFTALVAPRAAHAAPSDADRVAARALAAEGQEALEKNDFTTAADRFTKADALIHAPTLMLGLAHAQVGLGKLAAAKVTYDRIVREGVAPRSPPAWGKALEDATREVATLAARVPQVTITVQGPESATVTIDGATVPGAALGAKRALPLDPGAHVIRAEAAGFTAAETSVKLREGQSEIVKLTLAPAAATTTTPVEPVAKGGGSTQKTLGFVALGMGGVGLVLGGVTGGLAIAKHGALADPCAKGCPADKLDELGSYHTLASLSTVGFIVGGVGAAAGTLLILTAPKARSIGATSVTPVLGLGYFGAKGTF